MNDLTHDGITQPISEWAADYGIPAKLIRERLKRGWTVERAITTPMKVRKGARLRRRSNAGLLYRHDGVSLTIPQWADRLGVSPNALRARLDTGWTVADTLSHGRWGRKKAPSPAWCRPGPYPACITFNGESLTVRQWAARLGIDDSTLSWRLKNPRWTLERALTTPNVLAQRMAANDDRHLEATA